jgi:hypothetical protein
MAKAGRDWVLATTLGELVGFAGPVAAGLAAFAATGDSRVGALVQAVASVLGGAFEGASIGWFQSGALAAHGLPVPRRRFAAATAAAAAFAWAVGLVPPTLLAWGVQASPLWILPWGLAALLALCAMGWVQARVLRRFGWQSWRWTAVTALAWVAGVAVPVTTLVLLPDGATSAVRGIAAVGSGVAMGAVVGLVSAPEARRQLQRSVAA